MSRNKKQRRRKHKQRDKGRSLAKLSTNATKVPDSNRAALLKTQAEALNNAGKEAEAIPLLKEALLLDSSLADVHLILGLMARKKPHLKVNMDELNAEIQYIDSLIRNYQSILLELNRQKQFSIALVAQEELCRLLPDSQTQKSNLVQTLCIVNQKERAAILMAELLDTEPDNKAYKSRFNRICRGLTFKKFDPLIKQALQSCFENLYEFDCVQIYPAWLTQIFLDPTCSGIHTAAQLSKEEDLVNWLETASLKDLDFFTEKFFLDGLRMLYITNPLMESFLVSTRKWLCINVKRLVRNGRFHFFVPFLIALGQQCFLNEYIYTETPEEKESIDEHVRAPGSREIPHNFVYALVSCYRNLLSTFPEKEAVFKELADSSVHFYNLIKVHVFDLLNEEKIKSGIKSFGTLDNQISKNVQAQYEENPYPRWIAVACYPPLDGEGTSFEQNQPARLDILVAGCGTGKQALEVAALYPTAKVTAIDLSRASLAYAQRKANESGLDSRLEFVQADILNMHYWEGQFDKIECGGVLHHMEDPIKGWQILTEKLKPGGFFKIALYSSIARKPLARILNLVKEQGFSPTLDGVRALRKHIVDLPTTCPERNHILTCNDFYTTSEARDFLFHVLNREFTLIEIEKVLTELGLQFAGFHMDDVLTINNYDNMFPEDSKRLNLKNWHTFEQKHPLTFKSMYQFWCRKSSDFALNDTAIG